MGFAITQNDDRARVLDAADIVRVVGEHVALKKKGAEYVCLCPFHDDHSPSMYVVPRKQMYHCFVCGAGGNAITFVMEYHKMGFREALVHLADRFGVKLSPPPVRPERHGEGASEGPEISREQITRANRAASEYFRVILRHPEHGAAARALVERRGLLPETVEKFGIGAAADRWDGLKQSLVPKGLSEPVLLAAGLLKQNEARTSVYDAFRDRLMFPIHNEMGQVIAFGGRIITDRVREDGTKEAKYLNSPETALFRKSRTLYALHLARQAIDAQNQAVVCEGYMDAIACHQAGITNVVATLGTALTAESAAVLRRWCDNVVLLFDGDEAGQRAADRAVEVLFSSEIDVRIATMTSAALTGPSAKDPDELLKQPQGAQRLRAVIAGAIDALEYRFDRLDRAVASLNISARSRAVEDEIRRLGELGLGAVHPIRRQLIVKRVAKLAGIDEETVRRAVSQARGGSVHFATSPGSDDAKPSQSGAALLRTSLDYLLGCVLTDESLWGVLTPELRALIIPKSFGISSLQIIAGAVEMVSSGGQPLTCRAVFSILENAEALRAASGMVSELDRRTGGNSMRLRKIFDECVAAATRDQKTNDALRGHSAGGDDDVAARLKALQAVTQTVGRDARSVPKPVS